MIPVKKTHAKEIASSIKKMVALAISLVMIVPISPISYARSNPDLFQNPDSHTREQPVELIPTESSKPPEPDLTDPETAHLNASPIQMPSSDSNAKSNVTRITVTPVPPSEGRNIFITSDRGVQPFSKSYFLSDCSNPSQRNEMKIQIFEDGKASVSYGTVHFVGAFDSTTWQIKSVSLAENQRTKSTSMTGKTENWTLQFSADLDRVLSYEVREDAGSRTYEYHFREDGTLEKSIMDQSGASFPTRRISDYSQIHGKNLLTRVTETSTSFTSAGDTASSIHHEYYDYDAQGNMITTVQTYQTTDRQGVSNSVSLWSQDNSDPSTVRITNASFSDPSVNFSEIVQGADEAAIRQIENLASEKRVLVYSAGAVLQDPTRLLRMIFYTRNGEGQLQARCWKDYRSDHWQDLWIIQGDGADALDQPGDDILIKPNQEWNGYKISYRPRRMSDGTSEIGLTFTKGENVVVVHYPEEEVFTLEQTKYQIQVQEGVLSIQEIEENRAPVLTPIADIQKEAGEEIRFTLHGTDEDGDAITYSAENLPEGATLDSDTGIFSWTPTVAGTYTLSFYSSDGRARSEAQQISIQVTEPEDDEPGDMNSVAVDGVQMDFDNEGQVTGFNLGGQEIDLTGKGGFEMADFAETRDAVNLIKNSGFDEGGFQDWNQRGAAYQSLDTEIKHGDLGSSVKIDIPSGVTVHSGLEQTIVVEPGKTYRVSFWMRKAPGTENQGFYIIEQKADGTAATSVYQIGMPVYPMNDNEWTYVEKNITASGLTERFFIYTNIYNASGTIWIDDISVKDVTKTYTSMTGQVQAVDNGLLLHAESEDKSLNMDAKIVAENGQISITGDIKNLSGTDRAVSVKFVLPFNAENWLWYDDTEMARTIKDKMTYQSVTNTVAGDGQLSLFPLSVLVDPVTGQGLSVAVPIDGVPQIFTLSYDNLSKSLILSAKIGLTAAGSGNSDTGSFAFAIYSQDGKYGFRQGLQKYYELYPEAFRKRPGYEAYLNYANVEQFDSITHRLILDNQTANYRDDFSDFGEPLSHLKGYQSNYYCLLWPDPDGTRRNAKPTDEEVMAWLMNESNGLYPGKDAIAKLVRDYEGKIVYIPDTQYLEPHTGYNNLDTAAWALNFRVNEDPDINSALIDEMNAALIRYYNATRIESWLQRNGAYQSWDAEIKHGGAASIKIDIPSGTTAQSGLDQTIAVEPGKTYRVSFWMRKAPGTQNQGFYIVEQKADGSAATGVGQIGFPVSGMNDNEWTYFEKDITAGSLTEQLCIYFNIFEASGTIWVDDISVKDITGAGASGGENPNLVKNPGFEQQKIILPFSSVVTGDGISGYSSRNYLDFDPAHMAVADAPLTFDSETLRPAVYNQAWDFLKTYLWPESESRQFLIYGNSGESDHIFTAPYVDIGMSEGSRTDQELRSYRMLSYQKIWRFWTTNPFNTTAPYTEEMLKNELMNCLLYGFYPSVGTVGGDIDKFREYYRQYVPAIEELSASGWEPVNYAHTGSSQVGVERFGKYDQDSLHYSIHNYSTTDQTVTVTLDAEGLGIVKGTVLAGQNLISRNSLNIDSQTMTFTITLKAGETQSFWIGSREGGAERAISKSESILNRIERMFANDLSPEDRNRISLFRNHLQAVTSQESLLVNHAALVDEFNALVSQIRTEAPEDLHKLSASLKADLSYGVEVSLGLEITSPRYLAASAAGGEMDIAFMLQNNGTSDMQLLKAGIVTVLGEPDLLSSNEAIFQESLSEGDASEVSLRLSVPAERVRPLLVYLVKIEGISNGVPFTIYRLMDVGVDPNL